MSKKKVVHIVPEFGQGGVQTAMLYSLDDLNEVFDYTILVITDIQEEWIEQIPEKQKQRILKTGATSQFAGWVKAFRLLKEMQPDVVICSLWKSIIPSVIYKILNRKTLLFGFFHTSYSPHLTYILLHKLLALAQDGCLADSDATKLYLSNFYRIKKIYTIPFIFRFSSPHAGRIPDMNNVRFAYFGNVLEYKNIDRSLAFCKLCQTRGLQFTFDLYTFGAIEEYKLKVFKLGLSEEVSIKNTIPLEQVPVKMKEYDFLLQLSNEEGMALAVVEAMSCGLVPVVTPVGEISRYSKDGTNAIWLDAKFDKKLPELFEKLVTVIKDPGLYNKLSINARDAFLHYKNYSDSLIDAIDRELNQQYLQSNQLAHEKTVQ